LKSREAFVFPALVFEPSLVIYQTNSADTR